MIQIMLALASGSDRLPNKVNINLGGILLQLREQLGNVRLAGQPLMFKNVWSVLNDKIDVPESHILHLWLTGQQGGERPLDMLVRNSVSLPIITIYFIKTFTAAKNYGNISMRQPRCDPLMQLGHRHCHCLHYIGILVLHPLPGVLTEVLSDLLHPDIAHGPHR